MGLKEWEEDELIAGIRTGGLQRNLAWEYIYKAWRPYYLTPILKLNGTEQQVNEVISKVIIDVENQIIKPDFKLHTLTLIQYFTVCLKRAWAKHIKLTYFISEYTDLPIDLLLQEPESNHQEIKEIVERMLNALKDPCKKILTMWSERYSMVEIAVAVNLMSEQSAKNAKSECMKKLILIAPAYV